MQRAEELADLVEELRFLHTELCLPTTPTEQTWIVPESIPAQVSRSYLPLIGSIFASSEQQEVPSPTEPLFNVCTTLQAAWLGEKSKREARIQTLFDEIEPIWLRLQVSQEEIQTFIEEHCGLSLETVAAYEQELLRVKVLRSESLGGFVQAIRQEIQGLWDRLLYGPRTMQQFEPFYEGERLEYRRYRKNFD
jgi:hypothetical protein